MANTINSGVSNTYSTSVYQQWQTLEETQPIAAVATQEKQAKPRKLSPVEKTVSLTALGCDTELKLARAGYMAAAAKAGIADPSAQSRFADQMLAQNPQLRLNDSIDLDDSKVKSGLLNRSINFTITDNEKAALEQFRAQYVKDGGTIRYNRNPTIDLRQAQTADGVTNPPNSSPNTKFRVLLNNNGKPLTDARVLAQHAENQYGGGNLWGANYQQIGELSAGQGVKPKITNITRVGNKTSVEFELTPLNRAVIHENYKTVQAEVNRARAIYEDFANNNELSSFLRGVFNGAVGSIKGTIGLLNVPETMKALWQIVSNPQETFNALYEELGETWEDFKKAPPNKKSEMVGEVVGAAVVEILLGKGIGKAGSILEKTKHGAELLEKAKLLKSATTAKIAEAFSDAAASAAKQKLVQSGVMRGLLPGVIPPELIVIAGNKLKNGAVKFADFSKQMINDLGEQIKPHLERLYRDGLISLDLSEGREILSSSGKVIDQTVIREAKEKVADLVRNNKPAELEKYLENINEKYGKDLLKELKATREKFVDGLYDTTRRSIDIHDLLGGHIREEHIGKSETWLRNRLKLPEMKNEKYASSFKNEETANRILGKFVKQYRDEIEEWLKKPTQTPLKIKFNSGESAGIAVERGKDGFKETNNVFVMLVKDNSANGWHFETAFPDIR